MHLLMVTLAVALTQGSPATAPLTERMATCGKSLPEPEGFVEFAKFSWQRDHIGEREVVVLRWCDGHDQLCTFLVQYLDTCRQMLLEPPFDTHNAVLQFVHTGDPISADEYRFMLDQAVAAGMVVADVRNGADALALVDGGYGFWTTADAYLRVSGDPLRLTYRRPHWVRTQRQRNSWTLQERSNWPTARQAPFSRWNDVWLRRFDAANYETKKRGQFLVYVDSARAPTARFMYVALTREDESTLVGTFVSENDTFITLWNSREIVVVASAQGRNKALTEFTAVNLKSGASWTAAAEAIDAEGFTIRNANERPFTRYTWQQLAEPLRGQ